MKKTVFITIIVAVAAGIGGYLLAGPGGQRGDLYKTYENCAAPCNEAFNTKLNTINSTYDACADNVNSQFMAMFSDCPCADPLKPPCITCIERASERRTKDLGICRATRDAAITQARLELESCTKECRKYILQMQQ